MTVLLGIFIILHGLVHLWYVVMSFEWVEFQPDMGWNGNSWIFSPILPQATVRSIAGILFVIATLAFVISGIGILIKADWMPDFILRSAIFSSLLLVLFWDGNLGMLVQKGIIGLAINLAVIVIVLIR